MKHVKVSILGSIIGMFYTGDTINAMTLGGLALAIGILIDQSIVALENVVRHAATGKPAPQAALDGTREVAGPLLVATLTFMVVFYPVVFLSGTAKYLFTPLAVATSFAIIAAYLLSITLIPAYCAHFLRVQVRTAEQSEQGAGIGAGVYRRLLDRVLRKPGRWIAITGCAVLLAGILITRTGTELFPKVDTGQFTIYVRMPTGTRIEHSEAIISHIEQRIIEEIGEADPEYPRVEQHPESDLQMLISNIGVLMDWPAAYTPNTGAMDAFMLVQLKHGHGAGAFEYVARLREALRAEFPFVEFAFDTGGLLTAALNFGEPAPIHVQVSGSDYQTAHDIAHDIALILEDVPVVSVVTPESKTVHSITLPGTLEPWADVALYAKISGYLETLHVDIGDWVKQGALLATIAVPEMRDDLRRRKAEWDLAQAQTALEELTYKRLMAVQRDEAGAVTQQAVDDAHARLTTGRARVSSVEATLAYARTLLAYAEICAPFHGIITERHVDAGDFIRSAAETAGPPLLRIHNLEKIRVYVHVPEPQVRLVRAGMSAEMRLDALPGLQVEGAVSRVAGALAPETRTMRTEIALVNPGHRLRAGMFGHVTLHLEQEQALLRIPSTAVHVRDGLMCRWSNRTLWLRRRR